MLLRYRFVSTALAALISIVIANTQPNVSFAQVAGKQDSPGNSQQQDGTWEDLLGSVISIDRPSGPVLEFVQAVRDDMPRLNIIVTEAAATRPLPEIKLEAVPIRGALSLLSSLSNSEIQVDFQSQAEGSEANVILVSAPDYQNPAEAPTVRVFNVKQLLGASNRESLLSAMEYGYAMMGKEGAPVDVKIHEGTGLLFIKGTSAQLNLAESIIHEIEKGLGAEAVAGPLPPAGQPEANPK